MDPKKLTLKKNRDRSIRDLHPWVFSGALDRVPNSLLNGDIVQLAGHSGEVLATGHYYESSIAFKALAFNDTPINSSFWKARIAAAVHYRNSIGLIDSPLTNAFRIIHGEGDGLPGLIVDLYKDILVIQTQNEGMYRSLEPIAESLHSTFGESLKAIYHVTATGEERNGSYLYGNRPERYPYPVSENGLVFLIDWEQGQKTGFFLDQRDNRQFVRSLVAGKRVLNAFSYTGGFSVAALAGGAAWVDSVDVSQPALDLLHHNLEENFANTSSNASNDTPQTKMLNHALHRSDCFKYLEEHKAEYDIVILDPPAFVKHRNALERGLKGYQSLQELGIEALKPGGMLITFSCSQLVSRQDFQELVRRAAAKTRRTLRIAKHLEQSPCHPTSIYHPEGEYLKGLLLRE